MDLEHGRAPIEVAGLYERADRIPRDLDPGSGTIWGLASDESRGTCAGCGNRVIEDHEC